MSFVFGECPDADLDFYQQIYLHRIGTPESDDIYVIGKEFPKIAECSMETSEDGRHLVVLVRNGDGGQIAHYLRDPQGSWTQITQFDDEAKEALFGPDDALYILSRQNAPLGKILRLPLDRPVLDAAEVVVPQGPLTIQSFLPTKNYLYVCELDGGPSRLRLLDHHGREVAVVPTEPVTGIWAMKCEAEDRALFLFSSFLHPDYWAPPGATGGSATSTRATSPASCNRARGCGQ